MPVKLIEHCEFNCKTENGESGESSLREKLYAAMHS